MKTGFIILNYNSWKMTQGLAEKVASFQEIDYVIIVDNVSTDDSFSKLLKIKNKKIHVVQSEKNGGYSYGNNYGAKILNKLDAEIMFISNPDVDIEEVDIIKLINAFENSKYSILSGIEYDINEKVAQPVLWSINNYYDDLCDCFFLGRKLRKKKAGIQLDTSVKIQDVEMVKGSLFAIRLCDFLEVEGFDEHVFLFCEERIISKKIKNMGKRIGIVTEAKYIHNHSASINNTYKQVNSQMKMLFESRMYYQKKYNHISGIKIWILKIAMKISIFEYSLLDDIHLLKRSLMKNI